MLIIKHRQNFNLKQVNKKIISGVEIDIRIFNGEIVLQHDPFKSGENFQNWIKKYNLNLLIINVKEEGLEEHIKDIMEKEKVNNYFILDETIPFIIKYCSLGYSKFALRVSRWEHINSALEIIQNLQCPPNWEGGSQDLHYFGHQQSNTCRI